MGNKIIVRRTNHNCKKRRNTIFGGKTNQDYTGNKIVVRATNRDYNGNKNLAPAEQIMTTQGNKSIASGEQIVTTTGTKI
jgi:hypothetical protein